MEYTKSLVNYLLHVRYEDLPQSVINLAKKHFLDCVGAGLAEAATPRSEITHRYFNAIGSKGNCRALGRGYKLTVENAAFANGILCHTICFDDSGPSHPSVTVVPNLLAMAEQYHFNGKEILTAQIIGYEIFQRLNAVTKEAWDMRKRGWHPTGFFGSVSSALQCSKLLNLDTETTQRALGIASSLSGGLSQNIGNMSMGLHAGNANRNGVVAAHLAQQGFTADPQPLEGRFGLMDALCGPDNYDISLLTANLGNEFALENPGITIKPYPNCWAHHKVLQAVLELRQLHNIQPEDIVRIEVDLQNDKPTYRYLCPKTDLEARYSLPYGIALALLDGELTLNQYQNERITSEDTLEMMARIVHVPGKSPEDQQNVTIFLKNGAVLHRRVEHSKGHPLHNPMTLTETMEKYRICASKFLPPNKVEDSMSAILSMETFNDVSEIMNLLIL